MPYYQINILLYNGKVVSGIKENPDTRIDIVYRIYESEAVKFYRVSQIKDFNCVMISRQCSAYKEWIKKKQHKKGMLNGYDQFLADEKYIPHTDTPIAESRKQFHSKLPQVHWGETNRKQE